jgi:hypothetical protein
MFLPLSGDANEGYEWEVQTDDGWAPYWDPQAYSIDGWHSLLRRRECSEREWFSTFANSKLSFEASFDFKPFVYLKYEPNV